MRERLSVKRGWRGGRGGRKGEMADDAVSEISSLMADTDLARYRVLKKAISECVCVCECVLVSFPVYT